MLNSPKKTHRCTTLAEQEEIRFAFTLLDSQGRGRVLVKDIRDALKDNEGGYQSRYQTGYLSSFLLQQELAGLDDGDTLSLSEFTMLVTKRYDDQDGSSDDVSRMFRLFDVEKKGYIELKDLKRIANELGENMTDAELKEMVDRASNREHGKVSLEEFSAIMNKKLWS